MAKELKVVKDEGTFWRQVGDGKAATGAIFVGAICAVVVTYLGGWGVYGVLCIAAISAGSFLGFKRSTIRKSVRPGQDDK